MLQAKIMGHNHTRPHELPSNADPAPSGSATSLQFLRFLRSNSLGLRAPNSSLVKRLSVHSSPPCSRAQRIGSAAPPMSLQTRPGMTTRKRCYLESATSTTSLPTQNRREGVSTHCTAAATAQRACTACCHTHKYVRTRVGAILR